MSTVWPALRGCDQALACSKREGYKARIEALSVNTAGGADSWCVSSYVGVFAFVQDFGDPQIIESLHIEMTSFPLAVRSAKATIAWKNAEMEKLRQQEIEKSKQAKPKL